jgi:2-dehydro-3-deoxygluconokinase
VTVSCDYNFRAKLWTYGKRAPGVMREFVRLVDVGIANEEDCQLSLGIGVEDESPREDAVPDTLDVDRYRRLCGRVLEEFPNLRCQAITLRRSHSASHNEWSACLCNRDGFLVGSRYDIAHITDRVGAGDSFAAGLIYAFLTGSSDQQALDFAVAASALKHTVPGDFNLVTVDEVKRLAAGGSAAGSSADPLGGAVDSLRPAKRLRRR